MYKLVKNWFTKKTETVLRKTDMTYIPFSLENTDYQAYLKWLDEGGITEPADE